MTNFACVCVNIFDQLTQLLQTFTANSQGTGSSTLTHTGGFGSNVQNSAPTLSSNGRFGEGVTGNSDIIMFAIVLFLFAAMFLGGNQMRQPTNNKLNDQNNNNNNNYDDNYDYYD